MGSDYSGVKFKVIQQSEDKIQDSRIQEMIKWAKVFHQKGLAPLYEGGSYGNLSFRIRNDELSFFITASHTALNAELTEANFVHVINCDLDNNSVYTIGPGEPSSETMLHFALYKAREDINCIMHGHCSEILAASREKGFTSTAKTAEYGTVELVNEVLKIADSEDFLIMTGHGFLALGKTLKETGQLALDVLQKCRKRT
jgi:L-fuculose-phosphate aldolase